MSAYKVIDLFAGPGGWDQGYRLMGRDTDEVLGVEWDEAACDTAMAAGFHRLQADIAELSPKGLWDALLAGGRAVGTLWGLIGSPPCQAWSMAGKRGGEHDRAACHELADAMANGVDELEGMEWADPRSALVCQPIRWARDLRPEWIALEEVPAVLGLWEHFATILEGWGYHTWTGVLNAEAYGVPQTRRRAFLGASLVGPVTKPAHTHSRYYSRTPDKLDEGVERWVSMYEALSLDEHATMRSNYGTGGDASKRGERTTDQPAATVTTKVGRNKWVKPEGWGFTERPAYTVVAGHNGKSTGAEWGSSATRKAMHEADDAAREYLRMSNHAHAAIRHKDQPASTVMFGRAMNDARWIPKGADPMAGQALTAATRPSDSIRVSVAEAAVLQTFPADFPWFGNQSKRYEQVGNAVPPRLAAHVLGSVVPTEMAVRVL